MPEHPLRWLVSRSFMELITSDFFTLRKDKASNVSSLLALSSYSR
jgi:hypothetical protein